MKSKMGGGNLMGDTVRISFEVPAEVLDEIAVSGRSIVLDEWNYVRWGDRLPDRRHDDTLIAEASRWEWDS